MGPAAIRAVERRGTVKYWDAAVSAGFRPRGSVPMYWFRGERNFGDLLAPDIVKILCGLRPVWVSRRYEGKLMSVGSILQDLQAGDTVWGAGLIVDRPLRCPPDVRFTAVRGPLTRGRIGADVPEVYGDPACLLPLFHQTRVAKQHEIGVVPHYVDFEHMTVDDPKVRVINVLRPWRQVVDEIRACEVIVSSSLHGLVVAEAYGIPASWITAGDRVVGGGFKFDDYYLGSGRDVRSATPWSSGLAAAIENAAPPAQFDTDGLLAAAHSLREVMASGQTQPEQPPPVFVPPLRPDAPTHLLVRIGDADVETADRSDRHRTATLDLDRCSIDVLRDQIEEQYDRVTVATPTWAHLRSALAPARLLGTTVDLEVRVAQQGPASPQAADLKPLFGSLLSVEWPVPAATADRVRMTSAAPVDIADYLRALTAEDGGPLRMPLRIGLSGRGAEAFVAGNPHVRYEDVDHVIVTPDRTLTAVDVLLREAPTVDECGPAGRSEELGIPILQVAGPSTLGDVGAAADLSLVMPPVDTWSVAPTGFDQRRGNLRSPARCLPADDGSGATVVRSVHDNDLVRIEPEAPLAYAQVQALRRQRHLQIAGTIAPTPLAQARLMIQLAAAGVPLVVADVPAAVRTLLGDRLATLLEENDAAFMESRLLREVASVRVRRVALQEFGPGAHSRRLAALAGHYVPPLPTISVLLVSMRPAFLADALRQISRQTWPSIEVVLGLHGDHFTAQEIDAALAASEHPVTVVRIPDEAPFGEALNRASVACSGTLLAKWDDDDLYGRDHLWDLALALDYSGASLAAKAAEYVLLEDLDAVARSTAHWSERRTAWVAGGTFLLRRQLLEELGGWRPVPHAVDHALIRQILGEGGTVYRTHGLGYLLRRHALGHTWDPGLGHFLRSPSQQWRLTPELRRVVLDTDLLSLEPASILARP